MLQQLFGNLSAIQTLVDVLPVAIFIKDAQSKFLLVNKACEVQWGVSFADLNGTDGSQFFPPDQMESFLAKDRDIFLGGSQVGFEEEFWNEGRKQNRFGHTVKMPVYDDHGKPLYLICVTFDITDRKNAELLAIQHKTAIDISHDGFWIVDSRRGILLEANQSYARMSGYTLDELRGMRVSLLEANEQSQEEVQAHISKIITQGWDVFETRHQRKDGKLIDIEVSSAYVKESQQIVAFFRDITERKKAEDLQRISAMAFETHEAILITDANAQIIRVNQAFKDITGYDSEDVIGKNPRILGSGRQDKAFYVAMWDQLLETGTWTGEIWDKRKNGQIYPKWMTITAVKDKKGKTTEYVAIFSDITARKEAEEEIYSLAFYDPLTKLPNRRHLLERIIQARAVSSRNNLLGAIIFLDMDRFKTLNDTMGHDLGDLFLIEVSKRLSQSVRDMDTVARIGGDEFVLLIEEIGAHADEVSQKIALLAEKIRVVLSEPYHLNELEHHSSSSIGVCLFRGNEDTVDSLLKRADLAMYQAKEAGRNTVRFFDPVMQLAVETHASLESDLRRSITEKQLSLHYQVQVDNEHNPVGAEALLRWLHPNFGMIPPSRFIHIAEESSLILYIGHWVLETACEQLALWSKREQTRHLVLAINVSPSQFKQPNFVDDVKAMVNRYQINPNLLKLELTEAVVLEDVADVITKMHALRSVGVLLSLDDFGTGYSSLSYLKQMPLNQVKIDQSFVRDIATDSSDALMVKTIIDLAKNFQLNAIAEGVETEAQLRYLKLNGCMAYQGYLFSKPVPIDEFERLLLQDKK